MTTIGSYEAKTHLPALIRRVQKGEYFIITKHGEPIAVLRAPGELNERDAGEIMNEMLAYRDRQKRTTGKMTVRQMIEEGRRY